MKNPRLDLHLHTNRSDGRASPEEVLLAAAAGSLDVVAPTDHDVPPGLPAGTHTVGDREVRVVAAAEVSGIQDGHELHLLVYFPGEMPLPYQRWLTGRAQARAGAYDAAASRLGLPLAGAEAHAGTRAVTRHHLAKALVLAGGAPSFSEAFPAFARAGVGPLIDLPFAEALSVARDAGGWTSWAHPSLPAVQRWLGQFAGWGLHAVETLRPRQDRPTRNGLKRAAAKHKLGITGGSDWHGWNEGRLGLFAVQGEPADDALRRLR